MKAERAILVLPKVSAYEFKSVDEQRSIEKIVSEWVKLLETLKITPYVFAEDWLAEKLVPNSIKRVYALGPEDRTRIARVCAETIPAGYLKHTEATEVSSMIRRTANNRNKIERVIGEDASAFAQRYCAVTTKRIRSICNEHLAESAIIIYLTAGQGFCNVPKPEIGDGRIIVMEDLRSNAVVAYIGGLPCTVDEVKRMIGVIYGNGDL